MPSAVHAGTGSGTNGETTVVLTIKDVYLNKENGSHAVPMIYDVSGLPTWSDGSDLGWSVAGEVVGPDKQKLEPEDGGTSWLTNWTPDGSSQGRHVDTYHSVNALFVSPGVQTFSGTFSYTVPQTGEQRSIALRTAFTIRRSAVRFVKLSTRTWQLRGIDRKVTFHSPDIRLQKKVGARWKTIWQDDPDSLRTNPSGRFKVPKLKKGTYRLVHRAGTATLAAQRSVKQP
ncbi:hypothetical protein ASD11_16545 [Aeromicrobium sp. Root495]|nr:hypothetical protein ASD11_16545 [Aeromicrobium sp. Root495]